MIMEKLAIEGGRPVRKKLLPFNRPWFGQEEIKACQESIKSGKVAGDGPKGKELEGLLSAYLKVKYAFLVTSGTSALELSLRATRISKGDEVICPSFTFVSTANAVCLQGAKPVFVDIKENTWNICPEKVEAAITSKTRAVIPVHYNGQSAEIEEIRNICWKRNLFLIEDAAQAMGSTFKGRHLGTFGDTGCFSFHETKNITCGEGGLLVTNDKRLAKTIEIMREKGTDRSSFLRGEVNKYTWIDEGSSYILSDILAAIALEQFKKLPEITRRRSEMASYLTRKISFLKEDLVLPSQPKGVKGNCHLYPIRVKSDIRDWVLKALVAEGIQATRHYVPLHLSPYAKKKFSYKRGDFPVTEAVSESLIRLPLYPQLSKADIEDIAHALIKVMSRCQI